MTETTKVDPKAEEKANRRKYGISGKPIKATQAWARSMNFDHPGVKTQAVILVNSADGTYTSVNLYDGEARSGYDAGKMTHAIASCKPNLLRKLEKGKYELVDVASIPVAEKVEGPALVAPAKAEKVAKTPVANQETAKTEEAKDIGNVESTGDPDEVVEVTPDPTLPVEV
jgi:hypothetical protein